jgi:hypothetical protein
LMFCHERYSLLFSSRKNNTIVSTYVRNQWGRKREERADHRSHNDRRGFARQRKRWHPSAGACGEWEHQRCIRRDFRPDTSLPRASPYALSHHPAACVLTIRRLGSGLAQPGRRAGILRLAHSRRRTAERSCAERETRERWKQEWSRLFHCLNRNQDGVSSTLA